MLLQKSKFQFYVLLLTVEAEYFSVQTKNSKWVGNSFFVTTKMHPSFKSSKLEVREKWLKFLQEFCGIINRQIS